MIATGCTGKQRRISSTAIMTNKFIGKLMIGQRYITIFTLRDPATNVANLVRRITPAVLKKDHLSLSVPALHSLHSISGGDNITFLFLFDNLSCVNDFNWRQLHITISLHQFSKSIFTGHCIMITFQ